VPGDNRTLDLALELLVTDGHIEARHEGRATRHYPGQPYPEEPAT
jgi:hypothetical protein